MTNLTHQENLSIFGTGCPDIRCWIPWAECGCVAFISSFPTFSSVEAAEAPEVEACTTSSKTSAPLSPALVRNEYMPAVVHKQGTRLPLALCTPTLGKDGVKRRWTKGAEVLGAHAVDVLSGLANSLREQSRKSLDTHRNSLQLENPIVLAFILSTVWLAHLVFI
ncbi:predicted protein [Histoplasma capsulatum H143]|uniref:Uncharacterized protein n=1 Tax=Ajellomyces capsulatus (strain H143) TaxID=544712 RepID=C6HGE9_AJECH|nr:predicted protein [Histoplasma capsulatum H143]